MSKELAKRTKTGVLEYTGKSEYKFGDVSKQFAKNLTGKDEYQVSLDACSLCCFVQPRFCTNTLAVVGQFGDISKKLFGNMMKKKGGK